MQKTNIVFLLGCSRSGKDTVGQHLVDKYNFQRVSFADAVKQQYAEEKGIDVSILHTQGPEKESHREGMISLAEGERLKNPLCWLEKAFKPYKEDLESTDPYNFKDGINLVVTDCRRIDEVDYIAQFKDLIDHVSHEASLEGQAFDPYLNIELWYVCRPDAEKEDMDILTHQCIGYARGYHRGVGYSLIDGIILNNSTLEQLYYKVDRKVENSQEKLFI